MAAASYTTDLTTINILDSDATPAAVGEPTGSTAGTTIAIETDHYVVSTACISKIFNATGVGGLGFLNGTTVTVPTDGAVYMWTNFLAPNAISTKALGGMQLLVGNTLANYKRFYVYGDDTIPYGGWQVNAINPANTASATQGTPSGVWQYFGMAANVEVAVARGYPLAWDAVRAGRGSIIITGGDLANGYGTFLQAAIVNDTNTSPNFNRWGIFSATTGGYTLQGRLQLGSAATAVDFRDTSRNISIKNTEFVTAAFNQIEILNATSRVDWTDINIVALGTISKGRLIVTDNADVNISNCSFADMDTFAFLSNSSILNSTFTRCGTITQGSAVFNGCTFDQSSATTAMTVSAPANIGNISNCTFISDGTGYAITLTGTAANFTLNNVTFTGYAAYQAGGTSTGNEAIFINIASGNITISLTGSGNTPSFRTAGATVTVSNDKTFTISNIVYNSEVRLFKISDDSELAGVENIGLTTPSNGVVIGPDSNGRYSFAYSHSLVNTPIKVIVISITDLGSPAKSYQPYYQPVTLDNSSNQSLLVSQILDRNYSNP